MKLLTIWLIALTCLLALAPAAQAVAPPGADERAMLRLINQGRAARDLPALRFEARLQTTARWMNRDMIRHARFAHKDSLGRDPFVRLDHFRYTARSYRGENLAAGNREVAATYRQWWQSPGHRRNMLNRHYRYVGISRVCQEGSQYTCYWTTEFGGHWTQGFD